jgi:pyruvate-ferredoxin/flavodoxin oxidoreductase
MRLALDKQIEYARELMVRLRSVIGEELTDNILNARQKDDRAIDKQRSRIQTLKKTLAENDSSEALDLMSLADTLVRKSVWIVGGDGWAYDIGYGGLDHVLASGRNVKVIVLDTEVYSNTGGQASKATGLGAVAKFAAGGKPTPKKDLGLLAMSYGYVYVAQIALGANDNHTIKVMLEAESFDGPSIIIAYSHCIAHGIDMSKGLEQQNLAMSSGYWPLFRFDPRLKKEGKNPFQLDSKKPSIPLKDYIYNENRYRILQKTNPEAADRFLAESQKLVDERWERLEALAKKAGQSETAESPPRGPGVRPVPPGNGKPGTLKPGLAGLPTGKKLAGKLPPGSE